MNFQYLKDYMDSLTDWRIPGNSVVVYKDNEKVFSYSSGYSNIEKKTPMKGDELLYMYSCSKPITVTAALQLYEKGKFRLKDPLYEFLPAFKDMTVKRFDRNIEKAVRPITMENLFTMTAGFTFDVWPYYEEARTITNGKMNTVDFINCMAKHPMEFHPGDHWCYGLCHDILAAAVEVISGKKFRDYVRDNIFAPLDMKDCYYHDTDEIKGRMAQQYLFRYNENGDGTEGRLLEYNENEHIRGEEYDCGGGGVITSVGEYGKYVAAMANGGLGLTGERILTPGTIELMKSNHLSKELLKEFNWPQHGGYGYGLGVRTMMDKVAGGSNGSVGEFGWEGAAGAFALIDTERKLGMIYAHHVVYPQEDYFQSKLRNVLYTCIDS